MLEILCPRCEELNGIHIDDYDFEPVGDGNRVRAYTNCAYCETAVALIVEMRPTYAK